jgi:uncharacterized membrane protein (DUF373 family)
VSFERVAVILKGLNKAVYAIEVAVAFALVIMTVLAVVTLGVELFTTITGMHLMMSAQFTRLISTILEVFILIELFRIAVAYMTHQNVLPTVFEAALIAVARKFVVFEIADQTLQSALALSALLLSVAVSWWLLARTNACEYGPAERL